MLEGISFVYNSEVITGHCLVKPFATCLNRVCKPRQAVEDCLVIDLFIRICALVGAILTAIPMAIGMIVKGCAYTFPTRNQARLIARDRHFKAFITKMSAGLNEQYRYITNCDKASEAQVVLLGESHISQHDYVFNSRVADHFFTSSAKIYLEAGITSRKGVHKSLDTGLLPPKIDARMWDNKSPSLDYIELFRKIGLFFQRMLEVANNKPVDGDSIQKIAADVDALAKEFLDPTLKDIYAVKKLEELRTRLQELSNQKTHQSFKIFNTAMVIANFVYADLDENASKTFDFRQYALVKALIPDEAERSRQQRKIFVAGSHHLCDCNNIEEIEPVLSRFLRSSQIKYLILVRDPNGDKVTYEKQPKRDAAFTDFRNSPDIINLHWAINLMSDKAAAITEDMLENCKALQPV